MWVTQSWKRLLEKCFGLARCTLLATTVGVEVADRNSIRASSVTKCRQPWSSPQTRYARRLVRSAPSFDLTCTVKQCIAMAWQLPQL